MGVYIYPLTNLSNKMVIGSQLVFLKCTSSDTLRLKVPELVHSIYSYDVHTNYFSEDEQLYMLATKQGYPVAQENLPKLSKGMAARDRPK